MFDISPLFFCTFSIVTSFLIGLIFFIRSRNKQLPELVRFILWQYGLGFFVWGFSQSSPFIINLDLFKISYSFLVGLRIFSIFATVTAYFFFCRGTLSFFLKNKTIITVFPLIWGFLHLIFFTTTLLTGTIESILATTVIFWGIILPANLLLSFAFFAFYKIGTPFDTVKGKFHSLVLGFGWFYGFVIAFILWFILVNYPSEFYMLKFASSGLWFAARAIGHLIILFGMIFYSNYLIRLKI